MIRPKNFAFNAATSETNSFQRESNQDGVSEIAIAEFNSVVRVLEDNNIPFKVFEDLDKVLPDAVFPNNWIAQLPGGIITVFPMLSENRRAEVRIDIIDWLINHIKPASLIDLRASAEEHKFLEGTGSIIFDHKNRIAFASESPRTNIPLFEWYCLEIGYRPISFESVDLKGDQIYHTNVMMTIASTFCLINLEAIQNLVERSFIKAILEQTDRMIIPISYPQMNAFAANSFEVLDAEGKSCFIISQSGFDSLKADQITIIQKQSRIVLVDLDIIQKVGGGGIRCMMAGLFIPNAK